MSDEKKPMNARCMDCQHTLVACFLPMPIGKWCKLIKGLDCPNCAASSKRISALQS
jgi:hypothetical protein